MKKQSVIVHGEPRLLAKHAARIVKHFRADTLIQGWCGVLDIRTGITVYFTNNDRVLKVAREIGVPPVFTLEEVAQQINDAIPLTGWINCCRVGQPSRKGWYDVNYNADDPSYDADEKRKYWNGVQWCFDDSGDAFTGCYFGSANGTEYHGEAWRGLAEEPIVLGAA